MNAQLNHVELLNNALKARRALPLDGHCSCAKCGDVGLDRDEITETKNAAHVADYGRKRIEDAAVAANGNVCVYCIEDYEPCEACGAHIHADDVVVTERGERCCEGCVKSSDLGANGYLYTMAGE